MLSSGQDTGAKPGGDGRAGGTTWRGRWYRFAVPADGRGFPLELAGTGDGGRNPKGLDVYLEETETYQPDLVFISRERMHIVEPARINGAPDLVVEILSPASAYYDLRKKYKTYERWVIPGFRVSLQSIF